ncbi:MAG: hypothetical protein ACRDX8_01555, partial [Acidimicrobiales bacterium]
MSDMPNNPYVRGNPDQGNPYQAGPAKYCSVCGTGLVAQAVICPNCGSPVAPGYRMRYKNKTAAVLLAVFLGPWTWLYTYRRNAWKFWTGLLSGVAGFTIAVIVAATYFATTTQSGGIYAGLDPGGFQYTQTGQPIPALAVFAVVICYLIPFAVWLWAIIDVAVAPSSYYTNY